MKIPVIIAAHNEEAMLERTLSSLNANLVEPHVVANGCDDRTAEVARSFGAIVYEEPAAGKLPAIQSVLRGLGDRALDPVLYTDADSYPISTSRWQHQMLSSLDRDLPSAASGPIALDTFGMSGLVYDIKYCVDTYRARSVGSTRFRGANMATFLQKETVLKRILELPHIWPGEDRAVELAIQYEGGVSKQVTHLGALVMTSSRYVFPVMNIATKGRKNVRQKSLALYRERAAEGSIPLAKYLKRKES